MKYSPIGSLAPAVPGSVWNGDAARGLDAGYVDRVTTGQTCRKPNASALIGQPLGAGNYQLSVWVPPYTQHVAVGFRAVGTGHIAVYSPADPYSAELDVYAAGTDPLWYWLATPGTVIADGAARALAVTDSPAPQLVEFELQLTGSSLRVYLVRPLPLSRAPSEALI